MCAKKKKKKKVFRLGLPQSLAVRSAQARASWTRQAGRDHRAC